MLGSGWVGWSAASPRGPAPVVAVVSYPSGSEQRQAERRGSSGVPCGQHCQQAGLGGEPGVFSYTWCSVLSS